MSDFSERFREIAERLQLSDKELGTILGVGRFTIERWRLGKSSPWHDIQENVFIVLKDYELDLKLKELKKRIQLLEDRQAKLWLHRDGYISDVKPEDLQG